MRVFVFWAGGGGEQGEEGDTLFGRLQSSFWGPLKNSFWQASLWVGIHVYQPWSGIDILARIQDVHMFGSFEGAQLATRAIVLKQHVVSKFVSLAGGCPFHLRHD